MAVNDQFFTLAGVAVGVVSSYLVSTLTERTRHRWEVASDWRGKKLEAYARYVSDVKHVATLAQRIAAGVGLDDRPQALTRKDGLPLLASAETTRSVSTEMVALLGSEETISALSDLNRAVWRLEWFARGLRDENREGWEEDMRAYKQAINVFHECARRDLDVPGAYLPREPGPSPRPHVVAEDGRAENSASS